MGKGDKIRFWMDLWVGDAPLANSLPDLFRSASNQEAKVIDYVERRGRRIVSGLVCSEGI